MTILDSLKNLLGLTPPEATNVPESGVPQLPPAEATRAALYRFVIDKLRVYQQEPTTHIAGLALLIGKLNETEQALYQIATWQSQPGKFRHELDRQLADNYIQLPKTWTLTVSLLDGPLPACMYQEGNTGLNLALPSKPAQAVRLARLQVAGGLARQATYPLDPDIQTVFRIGRGQQVQLPNGGVRTNDIAFLNPDDPDFDSVQGEGNPAISRHHATVIYQSDRQRYVLKPDEGGLPARNNKTKIIRADGHIERVDLAQAVYPLEHGDVIELGGSGRLLFLVLD
jgi:pSer/pThr/pTyr-binding forkhead associated (FHA) protein